jgi:hypothetical protein
VSCLVFALFCLYPLRFYSGLVCIVFVWRVSQFVVPFLVILVFLLVGFVIELTFWSVSFQASAATVSGAITQFLTNGTKVLLFCILLLLAVRMLFAAFFLAGKPMSGKTERVVVITSVTVTIALFVTAITVNIVRYVIMPVNRNPSATAIGLEAAAILGAVAMSIVYLAFNVLLSLFLVASSVVFAVLLMRQKRVKNEINGMWKLFVVSVIALFSTSLTLILFCMTRIPRSSGSSGSMIVVWAGFYVVPGSLTVSLNLR